MLLIPKRHGQTDGRLTVALPRSALASRGKNESQLSSRYTRVLATAKQSENDTLLSWCSFWVGSGGQVTFRATAVRVFRSAAAKACTFIYHILQCLGAMREVA